MQVPLIILNSEEDVADLSNQLKHAKIVQIYNRDHLPSAEAINSRFFYFPMGVISRNILEMGSHSDDKADVELGYAS